VSLSPSRARTLDLPTTRNEIASEAIFIDGYAILYYSLRMKSQDAVLTAIGARIRSLRDERGMKLKALAEAAGLSDAFLSRLERGQVSSSVANLIQIAEALGIGVNELFSTSADQSRSQVTVHRNREVSEDHTVPSTGYRWCLFAGGMPNDDLEVFHLSFPRKNRMDLMVSHPGQEYCYVISGRIRFFVDKESFDLGSGEGVLLNSELPHRAENIGNVEARILMVVAKDAHVREHFDWWRAAGGAAPGKSIGSRN
jgi:transcriptional regulator with XRE-family HTH domain